MKLLFPLWFAVLCTIANGYSWRRVRGIQCSSLLRKSFRVSAVNAAIGDTSAVARFRDSSNVVDDQRKKEALHILDCLTSPKDEDDPQYDVAKDIRRDNLLLANDYADLKIALRRKGLRTSGDKLEMITRLLLDVIDPSIKYEEISGIGPTLSYIDEEDIASKKVRVRSPEERAADSPNNIEPDADDLMVLKDTGFGDTGRVPYSANNVIDKDTPDSALNANRRLVMDGLSRKEVTFAPLQVRRSESQSRREDYTDSNSASRGAPISLPAYVAASKNVLKRWTRNAAAVVLLPDMQHSWRSKAIRVMADELSFAAQVVVVVPDINRGLAHSPAGKQEVQVHSATQFDDIVAAIHFARTEYCAKSVSLAGVGCGAGRALEAACDLYDLGRLAQFAALENRLLKMDQSRHTNPQARAAVSADELDVLKVEDKNSSIYGEIKATLSEYRGVFLKPMEASHPLAQDNHLEDQERATAPDPAVPVVNATTAQGAKSAQATNGGGEAAVSPADDADVGALLTEQEMSEFLSTTESFQQLTQLFDCMAGETRDDNLNNSNEKKAFAIEEVLQSQQDGVACGSTAFASQQAVASIAAGVGNVSAQVEHRAIQREVKQLLEASERAEKRKLLAPYAALNLQEIHDFVPRSVLAFAPERFDSERIGRELVAPTFFTYPTTDSSVSHTHNTEDHMSSAGERMHAMLAERVNEVGDYCFRVYKGTSKAGFVHSPVTEYDTLCSQEAVAMGALWADAFFAQEAEELPEGLGENKLSEGAFCEVSPEDMTSPVRPSALATYLHDDPTWLKNSRLEY